LFLKEAERPNEIKEKREASFYNSIALRSHDEELSLAFFPVKRVGRKCGAGMSTPSATYVAISGSRSGSGSGFGKRTTLVLAMGLVASYISKDPDENRTMFPPCSSLHEQTDPAIVIAAVRLTKGNASSTVKCLVRHMLRGKLDGNKI
jgi:hypothetical protein